MKNRDIKKKKKKIYFPFTTGNWSTMLSLVGLAKDIPITLGSQLYEVVLEEQRLLTEAVLTSSFEIPRVKGRKNICSWVKRRRVELYRSRKQQNYLCSCMPIPYKDNLYRSASKQYSLLIDKAITRIFQVLNENTGRVATAHSRTFADSIDPIPRSSWLYRKQVGYSYSLEALHLVWQMDRHGARFFEGAHLQLSESASPG